MAMIKVTVLIKSPLSGDEFEAQFLTDVVQIGLENLRIHVDKDRRRFNILKFQVAQWIKLGTLNDLIGYMNPVYCFEDNCPTDIVELPF